MCVSPENLTAEAEYWENRSVHSYTKELIRICYLMIIRPAKVKCDTPSNKGDLRLGSERVHTNYQLIQFTESKLFLGPPPLGLPIHTLRVGL